MRSQRALDLLLAVSIFMVECPSQGGGHVGLKLALLLNVGYPFWLARCSSLKCVAFWQNWVQVEAWSAATLDCLEQLAGLAGNHFVIMWIFEERSHSSYLLAHQVERALDRIRLRAGPCFLWRAWSSWGQFLQRESSEHARSCTWIST